MGQAHDLLLPIKAMNHQVQSQHLHIIRYAVKAGWLTWDEAMQRLIQAGQSQRLGSTANGELWVESTLLTRAQVDEALRQRTDQLHTITGTPSPAFVATLNSSFEPATHHSYETLLALPSVTMLRRQREIVQQQQQQLHHELGGIESSPVLLNSTQRMRTEEFSTLLPKHDSRSDMLAHAPTETFVRRTISGEDLPEADDAPTHDEPPELAMRSEPTLDPLRERYEMGDELGKGGGGRVVRAFDRVLGRYVAMKIMRSDGDRRAERLVRFMTEAQTTGQLEHPNIVPIYDFGTLTSGDPYYTMREVRNTSLRRVLARIREEDSEFVAEYSLQRMVRLIQQVCLALSYAHAQGVIHRDLKPDNIMLGDYGEVLLMDWGLARHFEQHLSTNDQALSAEGKTMGTPAYMPPEQARGELASVDELSDVYSIGAILYEVLTLEPPFVGDSPLNVMFEVVEGELVPPSVRAPFRNIPDELERICLRAMAPRKHLRFQSAKAFHDALSEWAEGLQPREASRRATDGEAWGRRYRMLRKESEALALRVKNVQTDLEPWAPIKKKRSLWSLEDRLHRFNLESARAFGHAAANFAQALVYMPGDEQARDGLADLYWTRYEQARQESDPVNALYFKALISQYDDKGAYQRLLSDQRTLKVRTFPESATLQLARMREQDRRFIGRAADDVGASPLTMEEISSGRYLLTATLPDRPAVNYPLLLERDSTMSVNFTIPEASAYLEGFSFVPEGAYISGGDPDAFNPFPERIVELPAFFCSVYPITFRDYLAWIDALQAVDPKLATQHAPQLRSAEGMLAYLNSDTGKWTPDEILIEGPARQHYPYGEEHEWNLPVIGINAMDASEFATWRAVQTGMPLRLPSSEELEKAGRGTDGRFYTWGNRFDATFCKMRSSRAEPTQLEPVGTFARDVSPYGVRDLSGGVQEWCRTEDEIARDRPIYGGSWSQDERSARLASRVRVLSGSRTGAIGMRLVYSLSDLDL